MPVDFAGTDLVSGIMKFYKKKKPLEFLNLTYALQYACKRRIL